MAQKKLYAEVLLLVIEEYRNYDGIMKIYTQPKWIFSTGFDYSQD